MKDYYVYSLISPIDNLPFYIGKGRNNRCFVHLKETYQKTENKKKYAVVKHIHNLGLEVIVKRVKEGLSEQEAYRLEEKLIKRLGRRNFDKNGILTNLCEKQIPPSSKGRIMTEEHKRKIGLANSIALKGKKHSKEQIDKMRKVAKERRFGKWMIGKKASFETKQKMSKTHQARKIRLGYINSPETRKKMSLANLGKVMSDETKRKISKALKGRISPMKGRHWSEESRKKLSTSRRGKPWTEARRRACKKK